MEYFTLEHATHMLSNEWLVKVDAERSKPYLFKFAVMSDDKCCCMISDTIHVWAEVLNAAQFARRWTMCNPNYPIEMLDGLTYRVRDTMLLLAAAHTFSGMNEMNFEVMESPACDLLFKLDCEASEPAKAWSWRWESFDVGPRMAAPILSQHLILPLMSTMHLACQSADPVVDLIDKDLEQAVDKMARTARRSMDTHVKHAMSKPRNATVLRRVTAILNQAAHIPPIVSELEEVNLDMKVRDQSSVAPARARESHVRESPEHRHGILQHRSKSPSPPVENDSAPLMSKPRGKLVRRAVRDVSPAPEAKPELTPPPTVADAMPSDAIAQDIEMKTADQDSATEDEEDGAVMVQPFNSSSPATRQALPGPSSRDNGGAANSDLDVSPIKPPPSKKPKAVQSSSDEDEDGPRRSVPRTTSVPKRGGARQPLKRGGKRF